ncbi:5 protein [Cytorhabdovirus hordei]|uniref:5 protein n=1 Tax=Cytorhabdovirus hordei TaxID=1985699 RepID=A0A0C5KQX0_9RHAB|nr:5 protein [Cytorhabdovirus hordei]AJP67519.1 5 protein [Cytorhabdovirus hordei]
MWNSLWLYLVDGLSQERTSSFWATLPFSVQLILAIMILTSLCRLKVYQLKYFAIISAFQLLAALTSLFRELMYATGHST